MTTQSATNPRSWLEAEVDLCEARIAALRAAHAAVANVAPWLDPLAGQQAGGMLSTLEIYERRLAAERDTYEAAVRRAGGE